MPARARFTVLVLTTVAGVAVGALVLQPLNAGILRLALLGALALFLAGLLVLAWPRRPLRILLLTTLLVAGVILLLPGRPADPTQLRTRYLSALGRYAQAAYVWGGEGAWGIDCSGLPRRALRDAFLAEGLSTANPALLRAAFANWWFDASAASLAQGHRGETIPTGESGTLARPTFAHLAPGDLAVTRSGVHCLVHLRDNRWIQADPGLGRVEVFDARTTDNGWFATPVTIHRWAVLVGAAPSH